MTRISIDQALQLALQHHRAGRLGEAEQIYRHILQAAPGHYDAMRLLGAALHASGRHVDAIAAMRQVLASHPADWASRCTLALAHQAIGQADEALREADAALAVNPGAIEALHVRGNVCADAGKFDDSATAWRRMIELLPNDSVPWANLAATFEMAGRLEEARAAGVRAVELGPQNATAHVNLGSVLAKFGRLEEAIAHHRYATQLAPQLFQAWVNLGFAAQQLTMHEAAARASQQAVALNPNHPDGHRNLGLALESLGQLEAAERELLVAAQLLEQRNHGADRHIAGQLRLSTATMLPDVYESVEAMNRWRERLIERVESLKGQKLSIDIDAEPPPTLFPLVYHGRNDRELMRSVASLIAPPTPVVATSPRPAGPKIRIGFVSRFLREHTIGRLNVGLITKLSRERFDVTVLKIGDERDTITERLRSAVDRFIALPSALPVIRRAVAEQQLDVLFYTDIGMEPMSYALAFSRLAPVQCVTWGHPVTTGISTMDYFISAEGMEVAGSEDQYTERLVRLKTPAVCYERPTPPPQLKARDDFNLPADATIYGCLQMLWKLHPEFDAILADVLRRDPRGVILLLEGVSSTWTDTFMTRVRRTMGESVDRIRILQQMPYRDFHSLTSLCDVMLDPIHFGGGNTSIEAFAFGVPVITWPSQMARGRITNALYDMMGINDCIADTHEQYVDLATAIAKDPARRRDISEKILAAHSKLFDNASGVRELEDFFTSVARRS